MRHLVCIYDTDEPVSAVVFRVGGRDWQYIYHFVQ